MRLTILLPVYDDWAAAATLLGQLDLALCAAGLTASVLVANNSRPATWLASVQV